MLIHNDVLTSQMQPATPKFLQQLQQNFTAYLLNDDLAINHLVNSRNPTERKTRLAIYQDAYYLRLLESLTQDYSTLYQLLGEQEFTQLALAYIRTYPSTHTSLRYFGQHMKSFIAQSSLYKDKSYLAEIATFEWLFLECFDASDHETLDADRLAQLPEEDWPGLTIKLQPSLRMLSCQYNSIEIYTAIRQQQSLPPVKTLCKTTNILIWRVALVTQYRTLSIDEHTLLQSALEGENFSTLCSLATKYTDDAESAARHAVGLLKAWLQAGLIISIGH